MSIGGGQQFQSGQSSDIFSQLMNSITQSVSGQQGSSAVTPTQDPMFTAFRESILPAISQQYAQAQTPVYGQAQVAQVANQGNTATQAGEQAVANNAARRGTLNSGATDAANTSLQAANTANVTNFQNQIPFLNAQEQFGRTQGLLGLASSFLGQAPIGQTTNYGQTGSQYGTTQQAATGTNKQVQSGSTSGYQGGI